MQFIHTSLLFGLLAILIPVLIHLFQKQKPKTVAIPTFAFIEQALSESSSSRKIKSSLLLFMRMLLIALPVLLLAQPFIPGLNADLGKQHLIIIDNSYYSAQGQQLNEAKEMARDIIKSLPEGSALKIATVNNSLNDYSYIHQDILEEIKSLSPSTGLINFPKIINQGDDKKQKVTIHCITDLNKNAWKNKLPEQENIIIYTTQKRRFNNYINTLKTPPNFILNQSSKLELSLGGDTSLSGLNVQLYEDGEIIQTRAIPMNKQSSIKLSFNYTPKKNVFKLHFKLDIDDNFEADNHYYFVGQAQSPKKFHIIDQAAHGELSPGLLCKLALQQSPSFEIKSSSLNNLAIASDIYLFSGLSNLAEADWNKINNLSQLNKVIIFWPMPEDDLAKWSPRLLPLFSDRFHSEQNLKQFSSNNPILKDFSHELYSTQVSTVFFSERSRPTKSLIKTFTKKDIVFSTSFNNSQLKFCGLGISPELVNSNFIAPLIHLLTAAKSHLELYNITIGQSIQLNTGKQVSITNPEGIKSEIEAKTISYNKMLLSGFYDLSNDQSYAVNLERKMAVDDYFDAQKQQDLNKISSQGFHITSSFMTIILLIVILAINLIELRLTQKGDI
ncbi:BatA domain-containing protein [Lentisphaera profundi]|uniref:BatA domain-containing protein n=1 Tax=Lentisphaera profundi TaxID=1658616 RepID=A0ABY7VT83_9BACT|nr:BatA domain-containing protein [Lentisphaera profundi]WDE96964.1 BatA domain-containing protein [Lentisphaera profundi]